MDKQIRIVDSDLRDPEKRPFDKAEGEKRQWKVLRGISVFVGCYTVLHKLLIPLVLKFTVLHASPHAKVDLWVIPVLLWLFCLLNEFEWNFIGAFFSGAFIAHGIIESYRVFFLGDETGWVAFTHLLSSVPLAIASIALLVLSKIKLQPAAAWLGAILPLLVFCFLPQQPKVLNVAETTALQPKATPEVVAEVSSAVFCGAKNLLLNEAPRKSETIVTVESCGLIPNALAILQGKALRLKNHTKKSLNFHFYVRGVSGFQHGWNVLVGAGSEIQSPAISLARGEAGILFSDADPKVGLTAIVDPASFETRGKWSFSREPLHVEFVP